MGPWKRIVKNGKWRAQVTPARYLGNQRFGVAGRPIYALRPWVLSRVPYSPRPIRRGRSGGMGIWNIRPGYGYIFFYLITSLVLDPTPVPLKYTALWTLRLGTTRPTSFTSAFILPHGLSTD